MNESKRRIVDGLLMDRCHAWGYGELEDFRVDGTIYLHALKFEGHELPLRGLVELNSEWPPLSVGLFVFTVRGDEVGFAPSPDEGFPLDEEGLGVDLGLLHEPSLPKVIQHDVTLRILRKGELFGVIDAYLENSHH